MSISNLQLKLSNSFTAMAACDILFMPGFSEVRNGLERYLSVQTRTMFMTTRFGTIARLSRKIMGDQNGLCPVEEVFSMSSVDPGRISEIGCEDGVPADEIQTGLDCFGNKIPIETKGGNADSPLCSSEFCGEFTFGVDAFKPSFYSFERRFPTICVDAAMVQPREVKGTLQAIKNDGPKLVLNDLDYLMWDLVLARGPGNTSIAQEVVFGQDRGLTNGQFPYRPQSYLNHEFMKRIQEIVMMDPDNAGKKFIVEASAHQIQKAIEDDQRQKLITRDGARVIEDPFRAEKVQEYDGIRYISKDMADYVGLISRGAATTFIRPRRHVHQAGTEYGTVARPNYALSQGCSIQCNGQTLPKAEVAHWYLEDSIMYVPFIARNNIPTSGEERIKDNVYASPSAFKTYWVAPHAVKTPGDCLNDRNQYQQMGMRVLFGLFNRPDRIDHGAVLLAPVHRCITLVENCCPDEVPSQATDAVSREDDYCTLHSVADCPLCEGSAPASGGGELPAGAGAFSLPMGDTLAIYEELDPEITICVEREEGDDGAASIDYTTADIVGQAVAGTNYTTTAGTLNWAAGETGPKCFAVPILDNDEVEPLDFEVNFSAAVGATAPAQTQVIVTINPTPV